MFQSASVVISDPPFSFLLYETCKSPVKQMGFLLGEIIHKEITSITDNDQKQVYISKVIKINSGIPCPNRDLFPNGRVNKEKVRSFLGPNFSKVVGWYKFEPSSQIKFTLIDRALHKQFRELFDVPQDLLSVCLLTTKYTDTCSSYNYQQSFTRYFNGVFDKLNMHMPNLSESNNTYKNPDPPSEVCNKIFSTLKMDIENAKGVVAVIIIENALQNHIYQTATEVEKAEKILYDLENEVRILRRQKAIKKPAVKKVLGKSDESIMGPPHELLPETVRKSQRMLKSKNTITTPLPDSNKDDTDVQINAEVIKKPSTPKSRGRGRGRKKFT